MGFQEFTVWSCVQGSGPPDGKTMDMKQQEWRVGEGLGVGRELLQRQGDTSGMQSRLRRGVDLLDASPQERRVQGRQRQRTSWN